LPLREWASICTVLIGAIEARSRVMLPLRVFERIVAVERTELFPVTRSVVSTLPWREVNLAVGGRPFGVRRKHFFAALPSENICTRLCVGSGETRGSSDHDPRIASRFVYITRPFNGWVNGWVDGAAACRFLDRETDLVGGGEYAGGSSPGTDGGDVRPIGLFALRNWCSAESTIILRRVES